MNSFQNLLLTSCLATFRLLLNAQIWYKQNPKLSTHTLNDIDNNTNHFMAVGELGTIISSMDAGDTWSTTNPYPTQMPLKVRIFKSIILQV